MIGSAYTNIRETPMTATMINPPGGIGETLQRLREFNRRIFGAPPEGESEILRRLRLLEEGQNAAAIENAKLQERLANLLRAQKQDQETIAKQANLIIMLQSTITSNQREMEGHTAQFLTFSDTIGALKQQNTDQHERMVIMRRTIEELQTKLAKMAEKLQELPILRHQNQELILAESVWRQYSTSLREQLVKAGLEPLDLPTIPTIPPYSEEAH